MLHIWNDKTSHNSSVFLFMAWVVQLPSSWLLWCRFKFLHNLMNGDRLGRCILFIYNLTFSRPVGKSIYNLLARSPRRDLWFGMLKIYIIVIWPRCRWWLLTSMNNTINWTLRHKRLASCDPHRNWFITCSGNGLSPSYCLNRYWFIVICSLRIKLQWSYNQDEIYFAQQCITGSFCKVAYILVVSLFGWPSIQTMLVVIW